MEYICANKHVRLLWSIFFLWSQNTRLAIGNHDVSNITNLLAYTKKERYYSFNKNNMTFIVLYTELATPNIRPHSLIL